MGKFREDRQDELCKCGHDKELHYLSGCSQYISDKDKCPCPYFTSQDESEGVKK